MQVRASHSGKIRRYRSSSQGESHPFGLGSIRTAHYTTAVLACLPLTILVRTGILCVYSICACVCVCDKKVKLSQISPASLHDAAINHDGCYMLLGACIILFPSPFNAQTQGLGNLLD